MQGSLTPEIAQSYGLGNTTIQSVMGARGLLEAVDPTAKRMKGIHVLYAGETRDEMEALIKQLLDGTKLSLILFISSPLTYTYEFATLFHVYLDIRPVGLPREPRGFVSAVEQEVAYATDLYTRKYSR
jgi:hypothetical protein